MTPRSETYWRRYPKGRRAVDPEAPHFVYRTYDEHGLLLYVGCTNGPANRLATHRSQADWYQFVADVEVEGIGNRREALDVERVAIESEAPYFNSAVSDMEATKANIRAAKKSLRDLGIYPPPFDLERHLADDHYWIDLYDAESTAYDDLVTEERARLKDSTHPYMTDADRMGRYLAAREDAALASAESRAA